MRRRIGRNIQVWSKSERVTIIHLSKHLHLTNCIHLKHRTHMQRFKMKLEQVNPSETSLIRELSTLKKSRSLRDPSTSPSWKSGSFLQKFETSRNKDGARLQGTDYQSLERFGCMSSNLGNIATLPGITDIVNEGDESSEQEGWVEISPEDGKHLHAPHIFPRQDSHSTSGMGQMHFMPHLENKGAILQNWSSNSRASELLNAIKLQNSENRDGQSRFSLRVATEGQGRLKDETCSKDDNNLGIDKDGSASGSDATTDSKLDTRSMCRSSPFSGRRLHELLTSTIGPAMSSQERISWRDLTFLERANANTSAENDELEISEMPHNGCGVPWNWSKVHNRANNIQDISVRGTTGGPSDFLAMRLGKTFSKGHITSSEESLAMTSEFSDTSLNTDSESYPLLEHGAVQSDTGSPSERGQGEHTRMDQTESTLLFPSFRRKGHLGPSLLRNENSHHSLSEKFAPKSFEEIVGQGLITQALSNALVKGKVASMYIFHGPQGTGKTSCARLFSLALNCMAEDKPKPCGSCLECLAQKLGKISTVKEFAAGGLLGAKGMKKMIHEITKAISSRYRVFIVDECHILSTQSWNAFMKGVEEAPKNVIFILCTSNLDQVPHAVISRGQKYIFSKIRETDIVSRLRMIATQEGLEVDAEALQLVASACDGSLRDAEMMLDQLSLLGQKISLSMVQELMGLVSDENLVDLLDFALSADTVNTVRSLKDLMVSGVEPLNLMSQLACLITSLLGGSYQIPKGRRRRKFFRKRLSREDMERLRQALRTLSEAEKQLRVSADRTTWLTAALLQFAPDQSYLLPSSSVDTSFTPSPAGANNKNITLERNPLYSRQVELQQQRVLETASGTATEDFSNGMSSSSKVSDSDLQQTPSAISQKKAKGYKQRVSESGQSAVLSSSKSGEMDKKAAWQTTLTNEYEVEELWQRVLDVVHSSSLRKFLQMQGKLLSVSLCKGFAVVTLEFAQPESSSRAERSRTSIAHAFQATLGCPIDVKVQQVSKNEDPLRRVTLSGDQPGGSSGFFQPVRGSGDGKACSSSMSVGKDQQPDMKSQSLHQKKIQAPDVFRVPADHSKPQNIFKTSNVVEIDAAGTGRTCGVPAAALDSHISEDKLESAWVQVSQDGGFLTRSSSKAGMNTQEGEGIRQKRSLQNRVSLGYVMQQAERSVDEYSQDLEFDCVNEGSSFHLRHNAGYEGTASEMAARLEEENLKLESRSRGFCCWKLNNEAPLDKGNQFEGSPEPKRSGFGLNLCPCTKSG